APSRHRHDAGVVAPRGDAEDVQQADALGDDDVLFAAHRRSPSVTRRACVTMAGGSCRRNRMAFAHITTACLSVISGFGAFACAASARASRFGGDATGYDTRPGSIANAARCSMSVIGRHAAPTL